MSDDRGKRKVTIRIEHGDCLEVIPRLVAGGVVADAVCCDPPYHLTATAKRFGGGNAAPAQFGRDGAMSRLSGGFMGQKWDGGDIAFRPETWATIATILRPGGFLVAFGGTRTHHRVWCAVEDAGFVIQDTIAWLFGSGFPKRRDMLKPAFEPIIMAYKPGGKRTLQVDECRIEGTGNKTFRNRYAGNRSREQYRTGTASRAVATDLGRWPANVIHDGSDEVLACFPDAPGMLAPVRPNSGTGQKTNGILGKFRENSNHDPRGDTGSAARFFYCAKADAEDRWGSRHPTVKPVDLIAWLVALVCPPGGLFLDPFAGSGTAAVAALRTGRRAILIEREEHYVADIRERLTFYEGEGRHSLQAKSRRSATQSPGPLFAGAAE